MKSSVFLLSVVQGFYLPGVAPKDYRKEDLVPLLVNSLTAKDSLLPYDFYDGDFNFCKPPEIKPVKESLGSILFGDRLFNSAFKLPALLNQTCLKLCDSKNNANQMKFIKERIEEKYLFNWVVDGLPVAEKYHVESTNEVIYNAGIPLGIKSTENFLFNHYRFHVKYHPHGDDRYRIVGVLASGFSMLPSTQKNGCVVSGKKEFAVTGEAADVSYTYDVVWEEDSKSWGTRWDNYLHVYDAQIHWFSILNSIIIVIILSSMVTMILVRALHKDIARYNTLDDEDGAHDDFGWKMVHADVFRPPIHRMVLSILLGTGAQLGCMIGVTIIFAVLGFLSPSSRGSLPTMALVFYIFFSSIAGYVSSIMYKSYQGENRKQNVVLTAVVVPTIIFSILLILNFVLISKNSASAVPFGTLVALMAMWCLISIPLCVFGAYFGFRHSGFDAPCRTNQIPRQIPSQPWYLGQSATFLIGGILPFGAIFIELLFIMTSIWSHRLYYMFGFLMFVFVILTMTCCLVSTLLTYFSLCSEDYNWVWKSFFASASAGFYVFIYSIVFYIKNLHYHESASAFIYFTWSLVISILFSIFTGTVGHLASFFFVRKIYKSIKVD